MRTKIIVNPMANKGNCAKRWGEVRSGLERSLGPLDEADVAMTKAPNHATALAREAVTTGYRRVVSVGGDGTLSETLNGVIADDAPLASDLVLAQVPAGTSNELSRSFGHLALEKACSALASGRTRPVDIFRAEARDANGDTTVRYGFLLAIAGAPATISYRASSLPLLKRLGPVAYIIMTAVTALTYKPVRTRLVLDGAEAEERPMWGLMLCSFEGAGEGLLLAPGADPGDGHFDVIEMGDLSRREALFQIVPKLGDGSYTMHPKGRRHRARVVTISADHLCRADVDGEAIGQLPLTVSMLPQQIAMATL
jgi:YegS/Rv2252/BmrU family lipid kinase